MIMDPRLHGLSVSVNGLPLSNQPLPLFQNPTFVQGPMFGNTFLDSGLGGGIQYVPHEGVQSVGATSSTQSSTLTLEEEFPEDCDFSDAVLRYISQMLMEEDMEDKACMLQESLDLQAAEKSLYEAIGKKYPPSPEIIYQNQNPDLDFVAVKTGGYLEDIVSMPTWSDSHTQSSYRTSSSSNSTINGVDGILDSPSSILQTPDLASESRSIWHFKKGVEEANRFLPNSSGFLDNLKLRKKLYDTQVKVERGDDKDCSPIREYSPNGARGKKNPLRENDDDAEERSSKQAAVFAEPDVSSDKFDLVLLCTGTNEGGRNHLTVLREALNNGADSNMLQNGQSKAKGSSSGRGRGKKQGKKEVIDLRTLLISCAQAVAADDRISTSEILRQIRQHASPFGDGTQRLSQVLADGLEARLAGTGSQIYKGLISKRTTAAEILKAYHLFLAACPFRKLSNFISNKTILKMAETSTRIHIIDFGILYGFQWPTLIQRLSMRPKGPPRVRITGIEFPQPGFRPAERVEETGRRLAAYAEKFGVPFEYTAIAKKWETVQIEELKINRDELLIVNCLYRSKNLLDETVLVDSPRNMVFELIGKIKPDLFIHGIVNGSYNAPFFVTRFREAMFHFSALFDMLETLVRRENRERMVIEKEIFGREALNVIACEGWERVERPETYKQWQVRDLRAGFVQVPFDREIIKRATDRVKLSYHRDFLIDEDCRWLLQGWKGRIIYALSCWKPA